MITHYGGDLRWNICSRCHGLVEILPVFLCRSDGLRDGSELISCLHLFSLQWYEKNNFQANINIKIVYSLIEKYFLYFYVEAMGWERRVSRLPASFSLFSPIMAQFAAAGFRNRRTIWEKQESIPRKDKLRRPGKYPWDYLREFWPDGRYQKRNRWIVFDELERNILREKKMLREQENN